MSGLNPSGLGNTQRFTNAEGESLSTENLSSTHPPRVEGTDTDLPPAGGDMRNLEVSAVHGSDTPTVCWIFDDAYLNVYENRSVFINNDVPASIAVPTNKVGGQVGTSDERMAWEQIEELAFEEDWEMLSHGYDELNMDSSTAAEIQNEIYAAMSDFLAHGLRPRSHVYVGGATGGDTGRRFASHLYGNAWGINGGPIDGAEEDPFELPRFNTDNQTAVADIKAEIDAAIASGTSLALNGHHIITGTTSDENTSGNLQTSTGKIQEIIDYVKNSAAVWGSPLDVLRESTLPVRFDNGSGSALSMVSDGRVKVDLASGRDFQIRNSDDTRLLQMYDGGVTRLFPGTDAIVQLPSNGEVDIKDANENTIFDVQESGHVRTQGDTVLEVGGSVVYHPPKDVRTLTSVFQGYEAYHDGSGTNTEGPAFYNGTAWISQVDGTTIS